MRLERNVFVHDEMYTVNQSARGPSVGVGRGLEAESAR